jgi:hypothetical protein
MKPTARGMEYPTAISEEFFSTSIAHRNYIRASWTMPATCVLQIGIFIFTSWPKPAMCLVQLFYWMQ